MAKRITPMPLPEPSRAMAQEAFDAAVAKRIAAERKRDTEYNALADEVESNASNAVSASAAAQTSMQAAAAHAADAQMSAENVAIVAGAARWDADRAYKMDESAISQLDHQTYRCVVAVAGGDDPAVDAKRISPTPKWIRITAVYKSAFEIGDIVISARPLAAPEYLPAAGASYLRSAYPKLSDVLPFTRAPSGGAYSLVSTSQAATRAGYISPSKDGSVVLLGSTSNEFPQLFAKSGSTLTPLVTITAGNPQASDAGAVSSDATYVAVGYSNISSDPLWVFKRNGATLNRINPAGAVPSSPRCMAWSPDDTYLAVGVVSSVVIFKRTGDVLTNIKTIYLPNSPLANRITWAPDGSHIVVGIFASGEVTAPIHTIARTGDNFAAAVPQSVAVSGGTGVCDSLTISPDGNFIAMVGGSKIWLFKRVVGTANYAYQTALTTPDSAFHAYFGLSFLYVAYNSNQLQVFSYKDTVTSFVPYANRALGVLPYLTRSAFAGVTGPNALDDRLFVVSYDSTTLSHFGMTNESYPFNPATEFVVPKIPALYTGGLINTTNLNVQVVANAFIKAS